MVAAKKLGASPFTAEDVLDTGLHSMVLSVKFRGFPSARGMLLLVTARFVGSVAFAPCSNFHSTVLQLSLELCFGATPAGQRLQNYVPCCRPSQMLRWGTPVVQSSVLPIQSPPLPSSALSLALRRSLLVLGLTAILRQVGGRCPGSVGCRASGRGPGLLHAAA